MTHNEINYLLKKHAQAYNEIFDSVIKPNQSEINNITDRREREALQAQLNKYTNYINKQSELIELFAQVLAEAPTKSEYKYLQNYAKQARAYIRNLGGNPSIISYIKNTDLL